MWFDGHNTNREAGAGVAKLLAGAAIADVRGADRLGTTIDDVFVADEVRLDDRTRLRVRTVLAQIAAGVETVLRTHAARLLVLRDETALAERLATNATPTFARLNASGLLRDPALICEVLGRVRQDSIADALPSGAPDDPERPSLLPRLLYHPNPLVGKGAAALLAAESRRRTIAAPGAVRPSDLPVELHRRLLWWSAAALRMGIAETAAAPLPALDRALAEAAMHAISAYDENDRLEACASQLATALDPGPAERGRLMLEALRDRRLSLVIALLAHGMHLAYADMREIVLDPAGERLWLVLRVLDLDRTTIARIGLSLAEADPRRDIERFAESMSDIMAVDRTAAQHALAPLLLNREYRAALTALERGMRTSWTSGLAG